MSTSVKKSIVKSVSSNKPKFDEVQGKEVGNLEPKHSVGLLSSKVEDRTLVEKITKSNSVSLSEHANEQLQRRGSKLEEIKSLALQRSSVRSGRVGSVAAELLADYTEIGKHPDHMREAEFEGIEEEEEIFYGPFPPFPDTIFIDIFCNEVEEEEEVPKSDYGLFGPRRYKFPVLKDPGIDEAVQHTIDKKPEPFTDGGEEQYLERCKQLNVIPSKFFIRSLKGEIINFRYYGLETYAWNPMCTALKYNKSVKVFDVEGNAITRDGAYHLTDMLLSNQTLEVLNMTGCKISPNVTRALAEGVERTLGLRELNLSWNHLTDEGIAILAPAFQENCTIHNLILNNNEMGVESAIHMGQVVEDNWTITKLDLSWNSLFPAEGLKVLIAGLSKNLVIKQLNLAGNSMRGKQTAMMLRTLLARNKHIVNLDLSHNRFRDSDLQVIMQGLQSNEVLLSLAVGCNPITPEGAYKLLEALLKPTIAIKKLDLEDIWVEKPFLELQEKVNAIRKLTVIFRGVLCNYDVKGPDVKKLLLQRAKYEAAKPKKKKQKRDMGIFLLGLRDKPLYKDDFYEIISDNKVKLSKSLKLELIKAFQDPRKRVDIVAMKQYYLMLYPDTHLPEPKKKKKGNKGKKRKKGKDEKGKEEKKEA